MPVDARSRMSRWCPCCRSGGSPSRSAARCASTTRRSASIPGDTVGLVGPQRRRQDVDAQGDRGRGARRRGRGVARRPAMGYLPQNPRPRGSGVDATGLSHVLSGRGLRRGDAAHREAAPPHRGGRRPSATSRASPRAEEQFRDDGRLPRRVGRAHDRGRSRTRRRPPRPARSPRSPVASVGASSSRASCSRAATLLLLDEPTNHLDVDAKQWLMGFLRTYRGALLVISHDLDLLDASITRVLHLDEGELIEYKGTYSQYRAARAADEERRAKLASRQSGRDHAPVAPRRQHARPDREAGQDREGDRHAGRAPRA